eukprot:2827077-Lingulodinium_polyedra.AAC.1
MGALPARWRRRPLPATSPIHAPLWPSLAPGHPAWFARVLPPWFGQALACATRHGSCPRSPSAHAS